MKCLSCGLPIKQGQATVDDGQGLGLRLHAACVEQTTYQQMQKAVEPPFEQPEAKVTFVEPTAHMFHATVPGRRDGKVIWQESKPVKKADTPLSDLPRPACILCGKQASDEDRHTVRGQIVHAHGTCIARLERSLRGESVPGDVPMQGPHEIPVDANPTRKSRATPEEKKLAVDYLQMVKNFLNQD